MIYIVHVFVKCFYSAKKFYLVFTPVVVGTWLYQVVVIYNRLSTTVLVHTWQSILKADCIG